MLIQAIKEGLVLMSVLCPDKVEDVSRRECFNLVSMTRKLQRALCEQCEACHLY